MTEQRTPEGPASSIPDRDLYTIPSRSSWFNWDEIHETEKRELGEFFDGSAFSRNPRVYKEYRDFIINKYREDASRRLTFTEVRRSLVGDVGSIHKIFLFLDRWGLINFSASEGEKAAGAGVDHAGGAFSVAVECPPSTVRVVSNPSSATGLSPPAAGSIFKLPPLTSYTDVFSHWTPQAGRLCGDCAEECVSGYYESKSGIVICPQCFETGESRARKGDEDYEFHDEKIESERNLENQWTDRETLSLLEAVVSKGPDWDLIASHVRRSKLDCIGKLIQLPFDQTATQNGKLDLPVSPIHQGGESIKHELAHDSFAEQVASLSSIAGADVAAAAAEMAISALCDENPYAKKIFKSGDDDKNDFMSEDEPGSNFSHSIFQIRAATAAALAAAAAHAKLLADQEERQIEYMTASIIDVQIRKMGHKMKHFSEVESIMEQQYDQMQQMKEEMIQEWIDISRRALAAGIPRWKDPGLTKSAVA